MNEAPITAAEQREIRAMALSMIEKGCTEDQVRDAMKKAALLYRELKVVSAGPAKATK